MLSINFLAHDRCYDSTSSKTNQAQIGYISIEIKTLKRILEIDKIEFKKQLKHHLVYKYYM